MKRRYFLLGVTSALPVGAGCMNWNSGSTTDSTETTEPAPTDGGDVDTAPAETTTTVRSDPESYLPEPPDEWEYRGTRDWINGWTPLGARDGVIGQYSGPDGHSYEVLVMDLQDQSTDGNDARRLACAGWQMAVATDGHSIAASTGTPQDQTITPEKPPTMTQTAVPETEEKVIELLRYSPKLTEVEIEKSRRECQQDSTE